MRAATLALVLAAAVAVAAGPAWPSWEGATPAAFEAAGDARGEGPDLVALYATVSEGTLFVRADAASAFEPSNVVEVVLDTDQDGDRESSLDVGADGSVHVFRERPILAELDAPGSAARLRSPSSLEAAVPLSALGGSAGAEAGAVAYSAPGEPEPSDVLFPEAWRFSPTPPPAPEGARDALALIPQEALAAAVAAALALSLARLRGEASRLLARGGAGAWAALWLLCLAALALRLHPSMGPFSPHVFMDEWAYLEGGRAVLLEGANRLCTQGRLGECYASDPSTLPVGLPWLIAAHDALWGRGSAGALSLAAAVATLPALYLTGLLAGLGPHEALVAPLLLALLPLHVRYSTTASYESVAALLLTVSMASSLSFGRGRRPAALAASVLSAALSLLVTPAAAPALPALALAARPSRRELALSALAFAAVLAPVYLSHALAWRGAPLSANLSPDPTALAAAASMWWGTGHHTPLATALAAAGLARLARSDRRAASALALWLLLPALAFALHYIPPTACGQDRHMLLAYPALLVLAGAGARWARERLRVRTALSAALVAALSLPLLSHVGEAPGCPFGEPRDAEFAATGAAAVPDNCYVVTTSPFLVANAWGRRAIGAQHEGIVERMAARGDCLFFYENVLCFEQSNLPQTGRTLPATCRRYHGRFSLERVAASPMFEDPSSGRSIALYGLRPRASAAR